MKLLILYVTTLVVVTACFVMYAIISPTVTPYTPLPYYHKTLMRAYQKTNMTQDNGTISQRQRALAYSVTPVPPPQQLQGTLHYYKSLVHSRPVTLRCPSCAVVSSSGFLIGRGAGEEIDRQHCVIRMNLATVKGHSRDVGMRTTVRVMNFIAASLANRIPLPDEAIFVWGLSLDGAPARYKKKAEETAKRIRRQTNMVSLTSEGERFSLSLFALETGQSLTKNHSRPSTGWYTMMVAADLCGEIYVYGMVPPDYCSGAGEEIDRQHCVIRMNLATVKGHSRDVGMRTTVRVMNFIAASLANRIPLPDEAIFVWGLSLDGAPARYKKKAEETAKRIRRQTNMVSLTSEGERFSLSLFALETGQSLTKNHSRPSTGWYTMMVAADLCGEIYVYGMVPPDYCSIHPNSTARYHYFKKYSQAECAVYRHAEWSMGKKSHRFLSEKAVYARWAARYNISFRYPKWTRKPE